MIINTKYHIAEKNKKQTKALKLTFVCKALISLALALFATFLVGARSEPAEKKYMSLQPVPKAILSVTYIKHKVKQGECISDIAEFYSSSWQTYAPSWVVEYAIKEHNADKLYNGYILRAGDIIDVPIWIRNSGGNNE